MAMESERSTLEGGRPMMRDVRLDVRLIWQKMQVVAMDRGIRRMGHETPE